MKIIEVPAHRIYVVSSEELKEYDLVDSNGNYVSHWSASSFTLAVRSRDRKVFRRARFYPSNDEGYSSSMHYLEEV